MAQSMEHHDQRPTEPLAEVRRAWLRQTAAYARSVRLYQKIRQRQRAQGYGSPGRAVQSDPTLRPRAPHLKIVDVPSLVADAPAPDLLAPLPAPAERSPGASRSPLTARQLEIAALIAQGLTNGQIAAQIVVSRGTVGNHIGHMLRRLGVKNRAQIAAWMIRHGEGSAIGDRDDGRSRAAIGE